MVIRTQYSLAPKSPKGDFLIVKRKNVLTFYAVTAPFRACPEYITGGLGAEKYSFVHFADNHLNLKENSSLYDPKPIGQKLYIKVTGLNRIVGLKSQKIKICVFYTDRKTIFIYCVFK